jgi:hypothetical protein
MQISIPLAQWFYIRLYLEHNYCFCGAEYRIVAQDSQYITLEFKNSDGFKLLDNKLRS